MRRRRLPGATRRKPVQRERIEQTHVVAALAPVSDRVYILGTTRMPKCSNCGQVLARSHFTTRQTPGIGDVYALLKPPTYPRPLPMTVESREPYNEPIPYFVQVPSAVWVEVKVSPNKPTPEQQEFAALCQIRGIAHVTGGANDVLAFLIAGGWVKESNVPHYRRPEVTRVGEGL